MSRALFSKGERAEITAVARGTNWILSAKGKGRAGALGSRSSYLRGDPVPTGLGPRQLLDQPQPYPLFPARTVPLVSSKSAFIPHPFQLPDLDLFFLLWHHHQQQRVPELQLMLDPT